MKSDQPAAGTSSFPARELAAKKAMMAIASEIASSPDLRPLAAHLGQEVLALMLGGDTEVLADLMTQDPQVFRQAPMDQLNDHAFNMLFPHMSRAEQIAFGRALVQEVTGGLKKD
jgi:hypothetical protein